ncbi:MAG: tetratricopeptide repeat protein [Moorea sp. SIOASIH]|nr:tetratricopeptide repeat protein [Moorena sp. SIOASIH]
MSAHLVLDSKPTRQGLKLNTLNKYIQQHPTGWKKRRELAKLLYTMGRWQEAIEEYRHVIESQPQLIDVRLQLGKIFQLMARKAEAIEVYQSALPWSGNIATQHHVAGLIEVCRGRQRQAAKLFSLAASTEPDNPAHGHALAQVHLNRESPVEALQVFNRILEFNPDDLIALRNSYQPLLAVGDFPEASRRLERSHQLAPKDFPTLKQLADHRCRLGLVSGQEGKQTKQLIRAALQLAPDAPDAHNSLGMYHICRGEWTKGIALLQQFIQKHPNSPSGWYYYARCLFHTGDSQGAASAILKAYGLYPNYREIYRAMAEILPTAGKLDDLQPLVTEMLDYFPESWSIWSKAGQVLVEHFNDATKGCRVSALAVALMPQLASPWFHHGRVLALAGKHFEALEALQEGWQRLPEQGGYLQSVPAAVCLAQSYQALGDHPSSRKWWTEACDRAKALMDYNPASAYYWQGKTLWVLGDKTRAMQAYRSALSHQLLYPTRGELKPLEQQ